jgi:hypothetical protein
MGITGQKPEAKKAPEILVRPIKARNIATFCKAAERPSYSQSTLGKRENKAGTIEE